MDGTLGWPRSTRPAGIGQDHLWSANDSMNDQSGVAACGKGRVRLERAVARDVVGPSEWIDGTTVVDVDFGSVSCAGRFVGETFRRASFVEQEGRTVG